MGEVLLKLAERVEALTGPDREVDLEIARHFRVAVWKRNDEDKANYETTHWHYTASIDDALTLVPEGCWAEGALGRHDCTRSALEIHAPMTYDPLGHAEAATPALALCAAALRARATLAQKGGA